MKVSTNEAPKSFSPITITIILEDVRDAKTFIGLVDKVDKYQNSCMNFKLDALECNLVKSLSDQYTDLKGLR